MTFIWENMKILISNDDGYRAQGILELADALKTVAYVTIVAPDRNKSGASSSLTLDVPIRAEQIKENFYSVTGSPADCVHFGCYQLHNELPDLVVSGINHGVNLGDDVLYSGTVAAALEGRHLGMPSMAISSASTDGTHLKAAAIVCLDLIKKLQQHPLPSGKILNVNVPDLAYEDIKGVKVTRLGSRHRSNTLLKEKDPKGRDIYWLGPPSDGQDTGEGTDFYALNHGYVSVTPLSVDFTAHEAIDHLKHWMEN